MSDVALILYVALPAFVANMAPVVAARLHILPHLATPIDAGRLWRGKPLLGAHKTWRGVVAAVAGAIGVTLLQYSVLPPIYIAPGAYATLLAAALFGAWVGVLVMAGDALGSVIKRQLGYGSGAPLVPLDQIDYIVLFIVGTLPFVHWTFTSAAVLIVVTCVLNLTVNALAYVTGIKSTYW